MKRLIAIASIVTTLSLNAFANENAFEQQQQAAAQNAVVTFEVEDVTDQHPALNTEIFESQLLGRLNQAGAILSAADVIVDKVINIGTKIWTVLDKGRPVYSFNGPTANALPEGARRWDQLQNWRSPTSRVYSITGKNIYGFEILKFEYRVILLYGGDVGGVGRYIGYAAIQPATVNIPFLTVFNAEAKVESVYNRGSSANPVAGMMLSVNMSIESKIPLVPSRQRGITFELNGNGLIRPVSSY